MERKMNPLTIAIIGASVLCAAGAFVLRHDAKVAAKTEAVIVQRSEKQGDAAYAKSKKAAAAAAVPGALDRLRADPSSCTDCRK
jgi:hypothetical protein